MLSFEAIMFLGAILNPSPADDQQYKILTRGVLEDVPTSGVAADRFIDPNTRFRSIDPLYKSSTAEVTRKRFSSKASVPSLDAFLLVSKRLTRSSILGRCAGQKI